MKTENRLNSAESMRVNYIKCSKDLEAAFAEIFKEKKVGVDFETTGLDPLVNRIRLVQIARLGPDGVADVWVIDAFAVGAALRPLLADLFDREEISKVIHNAKFEIGFLRQLCDRRIRVRSVFDTMLASQLCNAGYFTMVYSEIIKEWKRLYPSHSLDNCCQRYLGIKLDKTLQASDWRNPELTPQQIDYAAKDAAVMLHLEPILSTLLNKNRLNRVAAIEFAALTAVVEKEHYGLPFDAPGARTLLKELEAELKESKESLDQQVLSMELRFGQKKGSRNKVFNPLSFREIRRIFEVMGSQLEDNRDETLLELALKGNGFAAELAEYRKVYKQVGFVKGWLQDQHPYDDRIHTTYQQIQRNNTGRFSSRNPNLQQIPKSRKFRSLFKVPEGRKIVDADYSAVELRIAADICNEIRMLRAFNAGVDLHRQTAALVSGKKLEEITDLERTQAKATNFGLIYGCGAETLTIQARTSYRVEMTLEQAEKFKRKFFEYYPRIKDYHRQRCRPERQMVQHHRYTSEKGFYTVNVAGTRTLGGRLRVWPSHNGQTQARFTDLANTPVQGTGASILKIALARLYEALFSKGWDDVWIIGSTHDEIMLEAPEEKANETAELLANEMQAAGAELIKAVPITAEVKIRDWLSDKD